VLSTSHDWISWFCARATRASILNAGRRSSAAISARAALVWACLTKRIGTVKR
jgi:hypothetical protein